MIGSIAPARILRTRFLVSALCACICLAMMAPVFFRVRDASFDFDGSYNLQVSTSLADGFVYKNNYHPYKIYDSSITTNGPMQYLMALTLQFFDLDQARGLTLFCIYGAFIGAAFWLSPLAALVAAFLALVWPALETASVVFLGELMAAVFCLLGIVFCEKWARRPKRNFPLAAAISFGLAVSTKFITITFIPFLIWYGLTCGRKAARPWKPAIFTLFAAVLVFIAGYYFSVAHSFLALWLENRAAELHEISWLGLGEFISAHFRQVQGTWTEPFDPAHFTFLELGILVFFICAAITALYENIFFIPVIVVPAVIIFAAHLNERRLLSLICLIPLLGAKSCWTIIWRWFSAHRRRSDFLFCGIFFIGLAALVAGKAKLVWGEEKQVLAMRAGHGLEFKRRQQLGRLLDLIRYSQYPIATSGWWQYPEASLLSGKDFFDRMAKANEATLNASEKLYLLFRPSQAVYWPRTNREYCGKVLLDENDVVFCEFNRAMPLAREGRVSSP